MLNPNSEDFLRNPPLLHETPEGEPHSHGLNPHVLEWMSEYLREEYCTLETGAGLSTILFANNDGAHVCIVPDVAQVERIRKYCEERDIATEKIKFIIDRSQNVLPTLKIEALDLALIDGSHSFPVAFLDFFFVASRLKVGGVLIVDDTNLWTGSVIKRFLLSEPEWRIKKIFATTVAFEKASVADLDKDWVNQPFVTRASRISLIIGKLRAAFFHLRRGEVKIFLKKLLRPFACKKRTPAPMARYRGQISNHDHG